MVFLQFFATKCGLKFCDHVLYFLGHEQCNVCKLDKPITKLQSLVRKSSGLKFAITSFLKISTFARQHARESANLKQGAANAEVQFLSEN